MKKVAIIIIAFMITQSSKGQIIITDTTQYLRDSIEARKNYFSSVYFGYLLTDLKINIKYYSIGAPLPSEPEVMTIDRIVLFFNSLENLVKKDLQNQKTPHIELKFMYPFSIPKSYLEKGGLLDWTTEWNSVKANFFWNKVIYGVNVRGL